MKALVFTVIFGMCSVPVFSQPARQLANDYDTVAASSAEAHPDAEERMETLQANLNATEGSSFDISRMQAVVDEGALRAVIIPVFQLEDASIREAIDALALALDKATEGKTVPNFVFEDPKDKLGKARITLQLKSIPAMAILEYINAQAGAKARYDDHAVVIVPR